MYVKIIGFWNRMCVFLFESNLEIDIFLIQFLISISY
jgi:hypothetical protein